MRSFVTHFSAEAIDTEAGQPRRRVAKMNKAGTSKADLQQTGRPTLPSASAPLVPHPIPFLHPTRRGSASQTPGLPSHPAVSRGRRYREAARVRKDVREFIRRLEAVGLTVESTPGHYHVLRDGKPLRKQNGMPFTLPFSPDTIRWRRAAIV
jgi:hypothetical protein